jgi:hypothetical protein
MSDKTQQQTLSVRISEDQRKRLECAREMEVARTGRPVSVSDVAKRLLESSREDRLEVIQLLSTPTATLAHIRRKSEAGHVLSRPEWTVVCHFVREGLEAFSSATPNALSAESVLAVLDAFQGLLDERRSVDPVRDTAYMANLEAGAAQPANGDLRRVVSAARRAMSTGDGNRFLLIGRNLCAFLEDEASVCAIAIDRVMRQHWPALWRVAARGHFVRTEVPVRDSDPVGTHSAPPIAPITDGHYTLSVSLGRPAELAFLISFPEARGLRYPIAGYPRLLEFRAMLAALGIVDTPLQRWEGRYFIGDLTHPGGAEEFWFRGTDDGISVGFSRAEWDGLRSLCECAWAAPDVVVATRVLARDYGEL